MGTYANCTLRCRWDYLKFLRTRLQSNTRIYTPKHTHIRSVPSREKIPSATTELLPTGVKPRRARSPPGVSITHYTCVRFEVYFRNAKFKERSFKSCWIAVKIRTLKVIEEGWQKFWPAQDLIRLALFECYLIHLNPHVLWWIRVKFSSS
jgi:hypothetical protein